MRFCARCMYPENARPTITFDENGICSGCNYHQSRKELVIPWDEREQMLKETLEFARREAQKRGNSHDCIIPVGGGKDSTYQVWLMKKKYGMNPLLVTYNHIFNTPAGNKNLLNLVEKSGCDFLRFSSGVDSVRKIARFMLEKVGDLNWHYHAGIRTLPFQVAVKYNIPLIVWGEHGFGELTGVVNLEDFVEFTKWTRKEHDMRGYEPTDLVGQAGITEYDIAPFIYPSEKDIMAADIRGIFLSNHVFWNGKAQADLMISEMGFSPVSYRRERSFNLHSRLEDHANDVHDYLKFLKFGYGRATDDASMEIRHGRLDRKSAIALVEEYDHVEPSTLGLYCDFLGISKNQFYQIVEPMRDRNAWIKEKNSWKLTSRSNLKELTEETQNAQLELADDQTFAINNRHLFYNSSNPPKKIGISEFDNYPEVFEIM